MKYNLIRIDDNKGSWVVTTQQTSFPDSTPELGTAAGYGAIWESADVPIQESFETLRTAMIQDRAARILDLQREIDGLQSLKLPETIAICQCR